MKDGSATQDSLATIDSASLDEVTGGLRWRVKDLPGGGELWTPLPKHGGYPRGVCKRLGKC
jgi:hypothetical protein